MHTNIQSMHVCVRGCMHTYVHMLQLKTLQTETL